MVENIRRVGTNGSNGRAIDGVNLAHDAQMAWREAQGATPLGPFEYVPPMGFREYWYPAVSRKDVGPKKPVFVKMLGEDIVFFRGKAEKVYGEVESAKATGGRTCAVSGKVVEVNGTLEDQPERVNTDPVGEGWMIKVEASDLADVEKLLSAAEYDKKYTE